MSFALLLTRILVTSLGFFGLATNTLNDQTDARKQNKQKKGQGDSQLKLVRFLLSFLFLVLFLFCQSVEAPVGLVRTLRFLTLRRVPKNYRSQYNRNEIVDRADRADILMKRVTPQKVECDRTISK